MYNVYTVYDCSFEKGGLAWLDLGLSKEISVTGLEIFPYEQVSPVTEMNNFHIIMYAFLLKEGEISIMSTHFCRLSLSMLNKYRKGNHKLIFLCMLHVIYTQFHASTRLIRRGPNC